MPMMDYEQPVPDEVNAAYFRLVGSAEERGSPILGGAAHLARQLFWIERDWPEAARRARFFLGGPQYWAWRLSGAAASELTYLGAQSHLWNIPERRFARIVEERGWRRLLPEIRPAWARLGPIKPEIARRFRLPGAIDVLCGIHNSSANFYRYQRAGLSDLAVISTGTWIVGLSDAFAPEALARDERHDLERRRGRPAAERHARHGRAGIRRHRGGGRRGSRRDRSGRRARLRGDHGAAVLRAQRRRFRRQRGARPHRGR